MIKFSPLKLFSVKYPPLSVFLASEQMAIVKMDSAGRKEKSALSGFLIQALTDDIVVSDHLTCRIANEVEITRLLSNLLDRISPSAEEISIVLPDYYAKVAVISVEDLPGGREDVIEIIKWKMKSKLPVNIDNFKVDFEVMRKTGSSAELLVVLMDIELIEQLERIFSSLNIHLGMINISSVSLLNLYSKILQTSQEDSFHIYCEKDFFNLTFVSDGIIKLYRNKDNRVSRRKHSQMLVKEVQASRLFYEEKMGCTMPSVCYASLLIEESDELRKILGDMLSVEIRSYDFREKMLSLDGVIVDDKFVEILAPALGTAILGRNV